MPEADRGRHERKPEVEDPVRADREDRSRERNAGPGERKRDECFDGTRSTEWKCPPSYRVAGRVADQKRGEIRRLVECLETRPQTRDVAKPIQRRSEERADVLARLRRELAEDVEPFEPVRNDIPPAAAAAHAVAIGQREERRDEPERDGDHPRKREP